jgi:hypothetical protein
VIPDIQRDVPALKFQCIEEGNVCIYSPANWNVNEAPTLLL